MFEENNNSISINAPTEESSIPRKHVREFEIIELRCFPGGTFTMKMKKTLGNETQK